MADYLEIAKLIENRTKERYELTISTTNKSLFRKARILLERCISESEKGVNNG